MELGHKESFLSATFGRFFRGGFKSALFCGAAVAAGTVLIGLFAAFTAPLLIGGAIVAAGASLVGGMVGGGVNGTYGGLRHVSESARNVTAGFTGGRERAAQAQVSHIQQLRGQGVSPDMAAQLASGQPAQGMSTGQKALAGAGVAALAAGGVVAAKRLRSNGVEATTQEAAEAQRNPDGHQGQVSTLRAVAGSGQAVRV